MLLRAGQHRWLYAREGHDVALLDRYDSTNAVWEALDRRDLDRARPSTDPV